MALIIQPSKGMSLDRVNAFVYGFPRSGKTHLALTFPNPVLVDFEDGTLTADSMGLNVPVIKPRNETDLMAILENPADVAEQVRSVPGFEDYQVKTFAFDTVSTLEGILLGEPNRYDESGTLVSEGRGILKANRNRELPTSPSIEDWRVLYDTLCAFFRLVRRMPYHTLITAHAAPDRTEASPSDLRTRSKQPQAIKIAGFPLLAGKLKYRAGGLADFFIYLEAQMMGHDISYRAYTRPAGIYAAGTRLDEHIDYCIEDPSFTKLYTLYKSVIDKANK